MLEKLLPAARRQRYRDCVIYAWVILSTEDGSGLAHDGAQFAAPGFRVTASTPGCPKRGQSPRVRPANADRRRAQRERLENVRAAPHAAVHKYGDFSTHSFDHFRQTFDRRAQRFFRRVRHDSKRLARPPHARREMRISRRYDALDQQLDAHRVTQPFHEIPIHVSWGEGR